MAFSMEVNGDWRDFKIVLRKGDKEAEVDFLFDHTGSETFDPTVAKEAIVGGQYVEILPGDALIFEIG